MRGFELGSQLNDTDLKGLHLGLALGTLAPMDPGKGKVPDADRGTWLGKLSRVKISDDYKGWYEARWKPALGRSLQGTVETSSRLLVGAGDASATDVGLRVHHTWGVPCIPGSALKGLLSHYLDVVYGPDPEHDERHPCDPDHPQPERAKFRRASVSRDKPSHGGGEVQRILFGSPDIEEDRKRLRDWGGTALHNDTTASRGRIVIHDAMFVPGSAGNQPFLADVLTVHHAAYYQGKEPANDHESPNPVGFLSVRPGTQLLLAIDVAPGEHPDFERWVSFAYDLLVKALADWGIGSKTAAGYGHLGNAIEPRRLVRAADDYRDTLRQWLVNTIDDLRAALNGNDGAAEFVKQVISAHGAHFEEVTGEIREQRLQIVYAFVKNELEASNNRRNQIRALLKEKFGG